MLGRMRVLVIDGDPARAATVGEGLAAGGLAFEVAAGALDGLAAAAGGAFDVVVLGSMPGSEADGVRACGLLRRSGIGTPVLMVAAAPSTADLVGALEAGADDCVAAGVAAEELGARVRALARRHLADRTALLRLGDVELDTATGRAAAGGAALPLTGRERQLLELLLLRRDAPQPQEAILAGLWGRDAGGSANLVDACVTRLRRKLRAAGSNVTVVAHKRRGYVLEVTRS